MEGKRERVMEKRIYTSTVNRQPSTVNRQPSTKLIFRNLEFMNIPECSTEGGILNTLETVSHRSH